MKFSIIIPVYKVEQYLDECVRSVLCQTYPDFEVILVDDGSPDNCPAMCDGYAAEDSRVKVIHKTNGGLSDARNAGLKIATGDYVAFLDSDDYWNDRNVLKKGAEIIDADSTVDVIFSLNLNLKNDQLYTTRRPFDIPLVNSLSREGVITYMLKNDLFSTSACTKLISRDLLVLNSIEFKKGLLSEDFDWFFQVFPYVRNIKVQNIYYVYRQREGSITHSISDKHINDLIWIIEKWAKTIPQLYKDEFYRNLIFNQLGFLYAMTLSLLSYSGNKRSHIKTLKNYKYLLKYDLNPKVNKVRKLCDILGLQFTILVLSLRRKISN